MKKLLDKEEIKDLINLIREEFVFITKTKESNNLGIYLKYPQLPSILTESVALHLLKQKIILSDLDKYTFDFNGVESDIVGKSADNKIKIEVKATGKSAFQYFGEKDIKADYLIWLHFGNFFHDPAEEKFEVYTINNPSNYFNNQIKITLDKLKETVVDLDYHVLKMESIE